MFRKVTLALLLLLSSSVAFAQDSPFTFLRFNGQLRTHHTTPFDRILSDLFQSTNATGTGYGVACWDPRGNLVRLGCGAAAPSLLYAKAAWNDLSDFNVGGTTPTVANGSITLPQPATQGSWASQWLELANFTSSDEQQDFVVTLKVVTPGLGIALGRESISTTYHPCMSAHWQMTPPGSSTNSTNTIQFRSATSSACALYDPAYGGIAPVNSPATVTVAAGDTIQLIMSQNAHSLTAIFKDITQQATVTRAVYSQFTATQPYAISNTSRWRIINFGGVYTVEGIKLYSRQPSNMRVAFVGTSKTEGRNAEAFANAWVNNLPGFGPVGVFGGDGDKSTEMASQLPYVLNNFSPQYVVLECCRNDIQNGITLAQSTANVTAMVQAIEASGKVPVLMLPIPDTQYANALVDAANMAAAMQQIAAADSRVKIIDPTPGFNVAVHLSGDNLHPNPAGEGVIAANVLASGVIPLVSLPAYTPPPSLSRFDVVP